jgi:hypothetical protein
MGIKKEFLTHISPYMYPISRFRVHIRGLSQRPSLALAKTIFAGANDGLCEC